MALEEITGNETGNQFIEKLNKNFEQGVGMRPVHVKMERGGLKSATGAMEYTIASYNGYIRSSMLIKLNGATKVVGETLTGFDVYEYKVVNGEIVLNQISADGDTFDADTEYIKIVKQTNASAEDAILMFNGDVEEVYNVQLEKGDAEVNGVTRLNSETLVFGVGGDICTTARLLLPSNYSISGKKVPLIIWCACDGSYPLWNFYIDHVGSTPSSIKSQLEYIASQGFAVLNVYPWGAYNYTNFPNCGQSGALPIPVTLRAYEKAVEYVTTRFNISDTNIFQLSWSGSGKLSAYWAIHKPKFNLRHIYAFSPVVDGGCFRISGERLDANSDVTKGFRAAANSEMHFDGSAEDITNYLGMWPDGQGNRTTNTQAEIDFVTANAGKFAKFSSIKWQNLTGSYMRDVYGEDGETVVGQELHEHTIEDKIADSVAWGDFWRSNASNIAAQRNAGIYGRHTLAITSDGAPITIIGALDDTACPFLASEEFIIQLRNGGAEAKLITMPNGKGGHGAPIRDTTLSGNGSPYGWWYAVQDIKARFLKLTHDNYEN